MTGSTRSAVVLKLSGEGMSGGGRPIDPYAFEAVAHQIRQLVHAGLRVGVVVGGGNIHRGGRQWGAFGLSRLADDTLGMYATALNAFALASQLEEGERRLRVRLIAKPGPVRPLFQPWRSRLGFGSGRQDVVIVAGGIGVSGVSTDVAAPLLARDMNAQKIVMSKYGVDGIFSKDPRTHPNEAVQLSSVTVGEALSQGLRFMDREAMQLCRSYRILVHVVPAANPDAFTQLILEGRSLGSVMTPEPAPGAAIDERTQSTWLRRRALLTASPNGGDGRHG